MVQHVIYLVRHGKSQGNVTKTILAPDEDVLTEDGKRQASNLGAALADTKFTKVFTSDYARTFETTQIILNKSNVSKEVSIQKEIRLREKDFGAYEGTSYLAPLQELGQLLAEGKNGFDWYPKDAETWDTMTERSDSLFSELCSSLDKSNSPETVMLTSHAFFIQSFMNYLKNSEKLHVSNWNDAGIKLSRNCSYMKFTVESRPEGYASEKRPLNIVKLHEWGHLDDQDSLVDFANSERGKLFKSCIQT